MKRPTPSHDAVPSGPRRRSLLASQDGIALLMVLVVITILTSLVVSLTESTQRHLQVTRYYKDSLKAYWAAQSGLQAAAGILIRDAQAQRKYDGADSPWNCESPVYQEFIGALLASVFCGNSVIEPAEVLGEAALPEGMTVPSPCPGGSAFIVDENRKLSLAHLVKSLGTGREETDPATFDRLRNLLQVLLRKQDLLPPEDQGQQGGNGLGPLEGRIDERQARDLALHLVDWIDTERNRTSDPLYNNDAAEGTCPDDGLPYEAKDGLLDSIDEIALVCGFRRMPRTTIERLARHLTVYDVETNVNTATYPVLYALCAEATGILGEECPDAIHQRVHGSSEEEEASPFGEAGEYGKFLTDEIGMEPQERSRFQEGTGIQSTIFRIGIYGVVLDPETGTEMARRRLVVDLARKRGRGTGQTLSMLYYRED